MTSPNHCPDCSGRLKVLRTVEQGSRIVRRRVCQDCEKRFTTAEKFVNVASGNGASATYSGDAMKSIGQLLISASESGDSETESLVQRLEWVLRETQTQGTEK